MTDYCLPANIVFLVGQFSTFDAFVGMDPFGDMFGGLFGSFFGGSGMGRRGPRKGQDVSYPLKLVIKSCVFLSGDNHNFCLSKCRLIQQSK